MSASSDAAVATECWWGVIARFSDHRNFIPLWVKNKQVFECVTKKKERSFESVLENRCNRRYVRYTASYPVLPAESRIRNCPIFRTASTMSANSTNKGSTYTAHGRINTRRTQ